MRKRQRTLLTTISACVIALLTVAALQSQPERYSDSRRHWIVVNADAKSRDANVLDAIIRDALTNQDLASARKGYGGVSNTVVRYTGFPANYQPKFSGHRFESLPSSNPGSGLKLTLSFSGLWIDDPPPKDAEENFRLLEGPFVPERGALLGFYNSGGPITNGNRLITTIGGCMFGYEIRQASNGWNVRFIGQLDP